MIKNVIKSIVPNFYIQQIRDFRNRKVRQKPKLSYSQAGEDIIIDMWLGFLKIEKPTYIDIGAYDPFLLSNSALFYAKGGRGINIEPNPILFKKFKQSRPLDVNLNVGVAAKNATLNYYMMDNDTLNSFSKHEVQSCVQKGIAQIKEVVQIDVLTVNEIIKSYHHHKFPDVLSLDVEGLDEEILQSIDFQTNFPKIICTETQNYSKGQREEGIINFLQEQGYFIAADTGINTIFVKESLFK